MLPGATRWVPVAERLEVVCGWEIEGSIRGSITPSVQGSFLPPLLGGPPLRSRPRKSGTLYPRQW